MSFADGMQWLQMGVQSFAGELATIRRGHQETTVTLVRGAVTPKVLTEDGMVTLAMDITRFIIAPQEYRFDDIVCEPKPTDRLIIGGKQYNLVPVEPGKPVWYWQDQYHTFIVLTTKFEMELEH